MPEKPAAKRPRTYSPSEFSAALADCGLIRSERWVQDYCRTGKIRTLPVPGGRYVIPGAELQRLLDLEAVSA